MKHFYSVLIIIREETLVGFVFEEIVGRIRINFGTLAECEYHERLIIDRMICKFHMLG